jgi:hypothetical protein
MRTLTLSLYSGFSASSAYPIEAPCTDSNIQTSVQPLAPGATFCHCADASCV